MDSGVPSYTVFAGAAGDVISAFQPVIVATLGMIVFAGIGMFFLRFVMQMRETRVSSPTGKRRGGAAGGDPGAAFAPRGANAGSIRLPQGTPLRSARQIYRAWRAGAYRSPSSRKSQAGVVDAGMRGLSDARATGRTRRTYDYGTWERRDIRLGGQQRGGD